MVTDDRGPGVERARKLTRDVVEARLGSDDDLEPPSTFEALANEAATACPYEVIIFLAGTAADAAQRPAQERDTNTPEVLMNPAIAWHFRRGNCRLTRGPTAARVATQERGPASCELVIPALTSKTTGRDDRI